MPRHSISVQIQRKQCRIACVWQLRDPTLTLTTSIDGPNTKSSIEPINPLNWFQSPLFALIHPPMKIPLGVESVIILSGMLQRLQHRMGFPTVPVHVGSVHRESARFGMGLTRYRVIACVPIGHVQLGSRSPVHILRRAAPLLRLCQNIAYCPARVRSLQLRFTIFAAGSQLRVVDQGVRSQVQAS